MRLILYIDIVKWHCILDNHLVLAMHIDALLVYVPYVRWTHGQRQKAYTPVQC